MSLFSKKNRKESSPFVVMKEANFGRLTATKRVQSFEDAVVDSQQPQSMPAGNFLGPSVLRRRFRMATIFVIVVFAVLLGRSAHLQIINGGEYRSIAEGNRFRDQFIEAKRGVVFDTHGKKLIGNAPAFTLLMIIADLPEDPENRSRTFARVADLAGLQPTDLDLLVQEFSNAPYEQVIVKKDLEYNQAMLAYIEQASLPGFTIEMRTKREYLSAANSMSHVLGYVGKINAEEYEKLKENGYRRTEEVGKAGVEMGMEPLLRGTPGKRVVEVDAMGNETSILSRLEPEEGKSITLSIDSQFQEMIEQRIKQELEKLETNKASVVAIDPRNGEIRALVSLPSYDSNLFAGGIDAEVYSMLLENPDNPLFPRAIAGEFPSGSTFKPYVAAAALAEGIITPNTTFLSVGGISIGVWFFPDWKAGGHGVTDVRKAIAESVNTFFYIIGGGYDNVVGLGVDRITDYASQFGFGSKTGIDIPNEAEGFLPSKEWKEEVKNERWYIGDTYHLAIGQGDILVTPLQMAVALSAVANGGKRYTPHVLHSVDGQISEPEYVDLSDDLKSAISVVREGMRQTVTKGSARSLSSLPFTVAGKTGTAQLGGDKETHAWFTAFAPYENPEIAIVVLIEEGGEGSSVAVPIARDALSYWFATKQNESDENSFE